MSMFQDDNIHNYVLQFYLFIFTMVLANLAHEQRCLSEKWMRERFKIHASIY